MKAIFIAMMILSGTAAWGQLAPSSPVSSNQQASVNGLSLVVRANRTRVNTAMKAGNVPLPGTTPKLVIGLPKTVNNSQTYTSTTQLDVLVRNTSALPVKARLEWFFIARDPAHHQYVWDQGQRDITAPPGESLGQNVDSVPLGRLTQKVTTAIAMPGGGTQLSAAAEHVGGRPYGWIVRLWLGDQVVRLQASEDYLEAVARDPLGLQKLLNARPSPP